MHIELNLDYLKLTWVAVVLDTRSNFLFVSLSHNITSESITNYTSTLPIDFTHGFTHQFQH
jgi:hypothetical protein